MLALLAAMAQDWAAMALWLAVALVVDGIDGPLARRLDVAQHAPQIDGVILDLVVDFLTYVMIPAYALYASGLMDGWSGWVVILLIPFASAIYFADTRMKTEDYSFRGFPACWNMVVLSLLVVAPVWWVCLGLVVALSAAMFLPLRFIHPIRTARWRALSLAMTALWLGAMAAAAATGFDHSALLTVAVMLSAAYLLLAGMVQQILREGALRPP